jgi:hypothetical protein
LHNDFHHFNILLSAPGWLVIDPKGVAGHAEYEVGSFLINPNDSKLGELEAVRRTERRFAILWNCWDSTLYEYGNEHYVTACYQPGGTLRKMSPRVNIPWLGQNFS